VKAMYPIDAKINRGYFDQNKKYIEHST